MIGLTFSLGLWQIDRAAQKEKLSQDRSNVQPTRLSGKWSADNTVYVDNRQMNSKQGFFVVTPLFISSSEYVLVQRGWIPRDFNDRKKLAPIDTPAGVATIEMRTMAEPKPPAVFAKEAASERPIVASIDLAEFAKVMPDKAYKGMAQQVGTATEGMLRNWYEPASGSEKNYGYAFQWFAMCAVLAGLYLWYQWIKPKLNKQHE